MRGKPTPLKQIADVVAAISEGLSISDTARRVGLDKATVSRIHAIFAPKLKQDETEKVNELAELVGESLRSKFQALRAAEGQLSDEAWRTKQSAEGLAELHKAVQAATDRLLTALSQNDGAEE